MNGLAKITIEGREIVLKFGLPAIRRILDKMGQYKLDDDGLYSDLGLAHILYAGYLNGCLMRDEIYELPFELFYNYIEFIRDDESAAEQVRIAIKSFEESKFMKVAVEKLNEEVEKKSHLTAIL